MEDGVKRIDEMHLRILCLRDGVMLVLRPCGEMIGVGKWKTRADADALLRWLATRGCWGRVEGFA